MLREVVEHGLLVSVSRRRRRSAKSGAPMRVVVPAACPDAVFRNASSLPGEHARRVVQAEPAADALQARGRVAEDIAVVEHEGVVLDLVELIAQLQHPRQARVVHRRGAEGLVVACDDAVGVAHEDEVVRLTQEGPVEGGHELRRDVLEEADRALGLGWAEDNARHHGARVLLPRAQQLLAVRALLLGVRGEVGRVQRLVKDTRVGALREGVHGRGPAAFRRLHALMDGRMVAGRSRPSLGQSATRSTSAQLVPASWSARRLARRSASSR
mmetsp:Transcript_1943/g.5946  ORF Transcript_1943/g.5946 Transcript_1943/m.5946 type:complete len:270 (-) Transcript_1943:103-912(-)